MVNKYFNCYTGTQLLRTGSWGNLSYSCYVFMGGKVWEKQMSQHIITRQDSPFTVCTFKSSILLFLQQAWVVSKTINTHFTDEMIVIQRVEIICSRSEGGCHSWTQFLIFWFCIKVEDRTGQPVGRGNLQWGENLPEGGSIQGKWGVLKINLDLRQVLRWGGIGSQRFFLEASLPTVPMKEDFEWPSTTWLSSSCAWK